MFHSLLRSTVLASLKLPSLNWDYIFYKDYIFALVLNLANVKMAKWEKLKQSWIKPFLQHLLHVLKEKLNNNCSEMQGDDISNCICERCSFLIRKMQRCCVNKETNHVIGGHTFLVHLLHQKPLLIWVHQNFLALKI